MFTQDFDLYQSAANPTQATTPHRAPSLDSTLPPSFNPAHAAEGTHGNVNLYSGQTVNSTQRNQRSIRPQVPLFHSNSTGSLTSNPNSVQYQTVTDLSNFEMGGGEINVAYSGTFGDLRASGVGLFPANESFDFEQLMGAADGFTAINAPAGNGTVSPKDIFSNDSVPPSTSFTNLTTPGSTYLETPDEEYQTSPLFSDNLDATHGADSWYSLFPDANDNASAPFMTRTASASSANQIVVHPGGEGNRKRGSTSLASPAPFSPAIKHSNIAGVGARKRDKPLPPILVDENDAVALKRARNTAAARKSRAKKVQERDGLEGRIADLEAEVEHWKSLALSLGASQSSLDD